jgi:ABC-type metal ion transport system substrate-binding protein
VLQAQSTRHLDDLAFACVNATEQTDKSLQQGAKALLFTGRPDEEQLKSIDAFFEQHDQGLILIFDKAFNRDSIQPILQKQFKTELILKKADQWLLKISFRRKRSLHFSGMTSPSHQARG